MTIPRLPAHVFKSVRALGIGSVESRDLANQIVGIVRHAGYSHFGDSIVDT